MLYELLRYQTRELTIIADQLFSDDCIAIGPGEQYDIWCNEGEKWKDWYKTSAPEGYNNPFAKPFRLRCRTAKCFCLCGVYDKDDETSFEIGMRTTIFPENTRKLLSFFANDVRWAYCNNHGQIKVSVKRIR